MKGAGITPGNFQKGGLLELGRAICEAPGCFEEQRIF